MRRAVQTEIFEICMYKYYWATKIQPNRLSSLISVFHLYDLDELLLFNFIVKMSVMSA